MHLDEESFLYVYKSIVRPHLEYANPSSQLTKDK